MQLRKIAGHAAILRMFFFLVLGEMPIWVRLGRRGFLGGNPGRLTFT